jgi:hypothetical protein
LSTLLKNQTDVVYLDYELVASESFYTLGPGTTILTIHHGDDRISIEFVISETDGSEANKMWAQVVSIDRVQVHVLNLRQIAPPQIIGPADLGFIGGRPIKIVLGVSGLGGKNQLCKHVSYSLYVGKQNA